MQGFDRTTTENAPTMHPTTEGRALEGLGSVLVQAVSTVRDRLARVASAHARRCSLEQIPPDIANDIGLSREDATGLKSQQPELPLFMQSGFGTSKD